MSEQIAWTDDKLSIHDGEYLVIQLSEKWWNFLRETHTIAIPLDKIDEARRERSVVDVLLRSALGIEE